MGKFIKYGFTRRWLMTAAFMVLLGFLQQVWAQLSLDKGLYWNQKKMERTDMPLSLNGVYFGSDPAKNLIFKNPFMDRFGLAYSPFSIVNLKGTEGAQGKMDFYTPMYYNEKILKTNVSSLGEVDVLGRRVVKRKKYMLGMEGNIYNHNTSTDRNRDKALDLPYRFATYFSVNYRREILKSPLDISLFSMSNRQQNGLAVNREYFKNSFPSGIASNFKTHEKQHLQASSFNYTRNIKRKRLGITSQSDYYSLQLKNYEETSLWGINTYHTKQSAVNFTLMRYITFIHGFKARPWLNLRYGNQHETLNGTRINQEEKVATMGLHLDKYWKIPNDRSYSHEWKWHLQGSWRSDYSSFFGWQHSPRVRINRQLKYNQIALVYEKNARVAAFISENRDLFSGNRKVVFETTEPILETSNKAGLIFERNFNNSQKWFWTANYFISTVKNKVWAKVIPETNEVRFYKAAATTIEQQVFAQLRDPNYDHFFQPDFTYRFDDIRMGGKINLLIPQHTFSANFKMKIPRFMGNSYWLRTKIQDLTFYYRQQLLGKQYLPDGTFSKNFFFGSFKIEFSEQLFNRKDRYHSRKDFQFTLGVDNIFNQRQSNFLISNDNPSSFNGLLLYSPQAGRCFAFGVKWNVRNKK